MFILISVLVVIVVIILLVLCFRLFQWTLKSKRRVQVFLVVLAVGGIGMGINHFFFKNMRFIQSKVYPNLYLVKYPDKDYSMVEKAIQEKIKEHLNTVHQTGKSLAYTNENGIYFYEYGGMTFGFIGEAGTGYFIDHEEDLGGFVSEELGMYTDYRLAEFYYETCPKDSSLYCGEINYFKEGKFFKVDSLAKLVSVMDYSASVNDPNGRAEQKKAESPLGTNESQEEKLPFHGVLDKEALAQYYPKILNEYGPIGNCYSERIALTNEHRTMVSLLHCTESYTDYFLYTHSKDFEAIDSFYLGKATDFDNGKSVTIDYKIIQDSTIVFNKVVWGIVERNQEETIDTLAHETITLQVNQKGGLAYAIKKNPKYYVLEVYDADSDPSGINLRDKPNGNIIKTLDKKGYGYIFSIVRGEKGWFRV